jgi:hypothetical protein
MQPVNKKTLTLHATLLASVIAVATLMSACTTTKQDPFPGCTQEGYFKDPLNSNRYWYCQWSSQQQRFLKYHLTCPPRQIWDDNIKRCANPPKIDIDKDI